MKNKVYLFLLLCCMANFVMAGTDKHYSNEANPSFIDITNDNLTELTCNLNFDITDETCNPNDDTFTFRLRVTGASTSGRWRVTGAGADRTRDIGQSVVLGPFPNNSGSTISFWVRDPNDSNCARDFTYTAPRDCGDNCANQ